MSWWEFVTFYFRYSILAPNAVPQGFVEAKAVTDKVLAALQLDTNEYRLGNTKVFFKAGVLGMLEDMRDERLSKIIGLFQANIRGYLIRKIYKKLCDQRLVYPYCTIVLYCSNWVPVYARRWGKNHRPFEQIEARKIEHR